MNYGTSRHTQSGELSMDAKFASRTEAFHVCIVGSAPIPFLRRIKSYAFRGSEAELISDIVSDSPMAGSSERNRNDSRRSRPFPGMKLLCGRTWKVPPEPSTAIELSICAKSGFSGDLTVISEHVHEIIIGL